MEAMSEQSMIETLLASLEPGVRARVAFGIVALAEEYDRAARQTTPYVDCIPRWRRHADTLFALHDLIVALNAEQSAEANAKPE